MTFLAIVIFLMVIPAWWSAAILARAARRGSHIGALTERAVIALAIAIMSTTGALITYNRTAEHPLFDIEGARILFSLSLIALGSIPVAWIALWFTGRLGDGKS